jgi:probable phosphoglycerate mutase
MILVVRHGETPSNAARVIQRPDTPLSDVGIRQAERLAERLAATGIARLLSSDLRRAVMTAERVAARTGVPLELEPLLQERNFGDIRGTAYAALDFDIFGPDYAPPGGESWDAFHDRAACAWERVRVAAAETPGTLAVITHGLVCRAFVERHCASDPALAPALQGWANASVTTIDAAAPWHVRVVNCTAHLGAPPSPPGPAPAVA